MRYMILAVAAFGAMSVTADAMPIAGMTAADADASIVRVAQGCGPGRFRGPMGMCHGGGFHPMMHRTCVVHRRPDGVVVKRCN